MPFDGRQQPRIAIFLALDVERLGHAVAEGDDEIAGAERHGFFFERRVLEQPEQSRRFRDGGRPGAETRTGALWPAFVKVNVPSGARMP